MRDLYATSLQLVHIADGNAFDVASERALKWAWRVGGSPPSLDRQPDGTSLGPNGTRVRWSFVRADSIRAVQIDLEHPDQKDSSSRWKALIAVSELGGSTKATVRLGLEATVYALKPVSINMRAPQIVAKLMDPPLLAYAGAIELKSTPRVISKRDADGVVKDELEAPGRALPMLIASSGVDRRIADELAKGLAGLLQIVRAKDPDADAQLSALLKESGFTVPRGGLRLFWPGFGTPDEPRRHPYWTSADLRLSRATQRSVVDQLARLLGPMSTARVPNDPAVLRARQEALREEAEDRRTREAANRQRARRQRESSRVAREAAERIADADERRRQQAERLSEVEALLDLADQEREIAEGNAKEAQEKESKAISESIEYLDRTTELEAELQVSRENIKTMSAFKEAAGEQLESEDPLPATVDSWEDLAGDLGELEGPGFCITELGHSCADGKGRYPHPDGMWKALRKLEEIGRAYNEMGADLGQRFDSFAFETAGLEVALQDSSYPDCWFQFDGSWHERLPHVKVDDAKSSNEVGRIYFAIDSERKRVIVDWFGTKPDRPNTKKTTGKSS